MKPPIFRFDDVCINTDTPKLFDLITTIQKHRPDMTILLAISPIVFARGQLAKYRRGQEERVHPNELTAMSDPRVYYRGTNCGLPTWVFVTTENDEKPGTIVRAGHGIVHVDHRLLGAEAQELSILTSCSLAQASVFVPPYNKWNRLTEEICRGNSIYLVKWEDGWLHTKFNQYDRAHERYYMHPYDMSVEELDGWFCDAVGDIPF